MFHSRRLWSTLRHLAIGAGATLILMNAASLPASAQVRSLTPAKQRSRSGLRSAGHERPRFDRQPKPGGRHIRMSESRFRLLG